MTGEPSSPPPLYSPGGFSDPHSPPTSSASKFMAGALYHDVDLVFRDIFRFTQVTHAQPQVENLNGQVTMLLDTSKELAALSGQSSFSGHSRVSQLLWDRLWHSVNVVGDRCRTDALGPLQNRLQRIIAPSAPYMKPDVNFRLPENDLAWYVNVFTKLEYFTETVEVLLAAIRITRHIDSNTIDGNLPPAARETVSMLHVSIPKLRQKLNGSPG